MLCPRCNTPIKTNAGLYCQHCGKTLSGFSDGYIGVGVIAAGVIILLAVVYAISPRTEIHPNPIENKSQYEKPVIKTPPPIKAEDQIEKAKKALADKRELPWGTWPDSWSAMTALDQIPTKDQGTEYHRLRSEAKRYQEASLKALQRYKIRESLPRRLDAVKKGGVIAGPWDAGVSTSVSLSGPNKTILTIRLREDSICGERSALSEHEMQKYRDLGITKVIITDRFGCRWQTDL